MPKLEDNDTDPRSDLFDIERERMAEELPPYELDPRPGLIEYTCERCGYRYNKQFDYVPFLCYRCMRFIAKRTFTIMHTIQPPISRPERVED